MSKLTVLIPCFNSEKTVRPTLESVRWADEILACDSFSTDGTLDLMREYGARIIQREYVHSASQKNWAIPQCSHDWILIVDTDEVLEPGLREEIQEIVLTDDPTVQAYRIPRKNFVYGKWMKRGGLYPDYQIRLFRKGKAHYENREVHAPVIVEGAVGTLKKNFLHNGFKDLQEWSVKTARYTSYESTAYTRQGRKFSWSRLFFYPLLVFLRDYILRLGCLDGYRGFLIARLNSIYYFMLYAKMREQESHKK